jgi:hypothetical protein
MAIAISLVRGAGERGPGGNWVRFAKDASGFILFGLGPKLGPFRKSLSCASQMFESGAGCERDVRGAGGRELGSFRKSLSGASQVFESGAGCEREVRGAGSEELGSFRKLRSRASRVFENGIGFVS